MWKDVNVWWNCKIIIFGLFGCLLYLKYIRFWIVFFKYEIFLLWSLCNDVLYVDYEGIKMCLLVIYRRLKCVKRNLCINVVLYIIEENIGCIIY